VRICRNVRRDAMKAVDASEKKSDLGEDEAKALSDTVQELTDDYVGQVCWMTCS
jgi:ribosome recycling factor